MKTEIRKKDQERENLKKDTFALIEELQKEISIRQIAINTNMSPSTLGYWIKGDSKPSIRGLIKVYNFLLEYKLSKGNKDTNSSIPSIQRQAIYTDIENSVLTKGYKPIPYVSKEEKQRYCDLYNNESYLSTLPVMPINTDFEYKGKYIVIEIDSDNMNDNSSISLIRGDRVLAKNIATCHWSHPLSFGNYHMGILHKTEGLIIKKVIDHDVAKKKLICKSLNPLYENITSILLSEVKELYYIIELVHRNLRT